MLSFKRLSDATPGLELLATSNFVLELRQFKDDTEIDLIKKPVQLLMKHLCQL